jgi:hypothetical protein
VPKLTVAGTLIFLFFLFSLPIRAEELDPTAEESAVTLPSLLEQLKEKNVAKESYSRCLSQGESIQVECGACKKSENDCMENCIRNSGFVEYSTETEMKFVYCAVRCQFSARNCVEKVFGNRSGH